jgi:hypothetical protein
MMTLYEILLVDRINENAVYKKQVDEINKSRKKR